MEQTRLSSLKILHSKKCTENPSTTTGGWARQLIQNLAWPASEPTEPCGRRSWVALLDINIRNKSKTEIQNTPEKYRTNTINKNNTNVTTGRWLSIGTIVSGSSNIYPGSNWPLRLIFTLNTLKTGRVECRLLGQQCGRVDVSLNGSPSWLLWPVQTYDRGNTARRHYQASNRVLPQC